MPAQRTKHGFAVAAMVVGLTTAFADRANAGGIPVSSTKTQTLPPQPNQTRLQSQIQGDESTLVLPRLNGPSLPPPPPAINTPRIPSEFRGCWEGDPGGFDWVATDAGVVAIGATREIAFCYAENEITVPSAKATISAGEPTCS